MHKIKLHGIQVRHYAFEEVDEFLGSLDEKTKEKVLYNLWKARMINDSELFKKLTNEIWEFRTRFIGNQIRLLAFMDKNSKQPKIVVCTNGFVKKKLESA